MADKIFLCVSASQATAGHWRGGKLVSVQVFANDQNGWSGFNGLLQSSPGAPVHLMVDTVEEDYRFENLPHSFGSDRREMIARKLRQLYRNNPYSRAWLQGREPDKRRDDRFLFAALTNQDFIAGWLKVIEAQQAPLAGIYLLPMASHNLLKKFGLDNTSNLLLVTQNSAGLRQTFFHDQRLRISRLTPLETISNESRITEYAEEIGNTRLYLAAVKVIPLEEPLLVVILDQSETLAGLSRELVKRQSNVLCQNFGRSEIVAKLGVAPELLQLSPDVLYLHMLGELQPDINLAPEEKTRRFWRYAASRRLYAASIAVALIALLWCGANLYQQFDYKEEAARALQQASQQQVLYLEVTKQFPAAPTSAENLRNAVEIAQKIKQSAHSPELMFAAISHVLDASPGVVLKSVSWKYGTESLEAEPDQTRQPSAASGPKKQIGVIEAEIRPFKGDYRAAITSINSFVEKLRNDKAVAEAAIMQLPLNVNPGTSLSGNTTDSREQTSSAPFKVTLSLRQES
ncbi:MAG TPA: hypothetical protein VLL03_06115 [Burkholderiales bacterium]|nr:hypothetical protein [Burkholderiales bacterium]